MRVSAPEFGQRLAHGVAVQHGQIAVEDDDVVLDRTRPLERRPAVAGDVDRERVPAQSRAMTSASAASSSASKTRMTLSPGRGPKPRTRPETHATLVSTCATRTTTTGSQRPTNTSLTVS